MIADDGSLAAGSWQLADKGESRKWSEKAIVAREVNDELLSDDERLLELHAEAAEPLGT